MDRLIIADIQSLRNINGQCAGHWISLAKQYILLFSSDYDVWIAGGPVYQTYFNRENLISLPVDVEDGINGHFEILRRFCKNALYLFRKTKNERVIIQYGSPFSNHIAILLAFPNSKLFLIEYSSAGINSKIKRIIFNLIKHKIKGIICPSESIGDTFGVPYCVIPDYIYTGSQKIGKKLSFEEKTIDFCLIGRISPEKGILDVARKFAGSKYSVLIAGLPETEELGNELIKICSCSSNIILKLEYISESEFQHILDISKYAILNYRGVYASRSSGVVFDTIFSDVPVVGSQCLALQFVGENGIGYLYQDLDQVDFDEILDKKVYDRYLLNIGTYKKKHEDYKKKLIEFIK